jgi:hypothetical protein
MREQLRLRGEVGRMVDTDTVIVPAKCPNGNRRAVFVGSFQ